MVKEMKNIKMEIPKEFTTMAGVGYGEKIFNRQIMDNIEGEKEIEIEIPDHISNITNTFLEGLLIGRNYSGENHQIKFTSRDKELEERTNFQISLLDGRKEIVEEDKMKIKKEVIFIKKYMNTLQKNKGKYSIGDIVKINTIDNQGEVILVDFEKKDGNLTYKCIDVEGHSFKIIESREEELERSNSNIKYSRNAMERFKELIYDIHPELNSQDFVEFMINEDKEKTSKTPDKSVLMSEDGLILIVKNEISIVYAEKKYVTGRMQPNYHVLAKVGRNEALLSIKPTIDEARSLVADIADWINTANSGNFEV